MGIASCGHRLPDSYIAYVVIYDDSANNQVQTWRNSPSPGTLLPQSNYDHSDKKSLTLPPDPLYINYHGDK